VFGLRIAGFACSVMAVKSPLAPAAQYLMLAAAAGASIWIILRGIVVEPPAMLMEAIETANARLLRLFGRRVAA
jgi:lipopolysaccharide export system permease protein